MNSDNINAKFAVLLAVTAVSTSALFIRLSQAPSAAMAANRLLLTLVFLGPVAIWRCGPEIRATKYRDRAVAALAGACLGLHFLMWFSSLRFTGVAASVVLVSTHPLFILAYTRFYDRKTIGPAKLAGTLFALAGIVVIALGDRHGQTALFGNLLALGGAVAVSGYFLLGRQARKNMSNLNYVTHTYLAAWLVLAAASYAGGAPLFAYPPREWLIFLALALFPTILGHTVFNWALARVDVSFVSVMILGEPVGATLLAYLFLHEIPPAGHVLGGILILAGLFVFVRGSGSAIQG
ncbi:MAG: DMT family transporter [Dethiobacter sp.]|nr:DMT family transporter [Dethiobacter sp.]